MYHFSTSKTLVAIDNFSDANKLGRGGFGPVYKVIIVLNLNIPLIFNWFKISMPNAYPLWPLEQVSWKARNCS